MGGPYLCRLLLLRSPSASSIPGCLTSLSTGCVAVVVGGLVGVKGGEERHASCSYIKCQCYPRHTQYTYSVMWLCDDHRESDATDSVQHPVGHSTDNHHFHICFSETAMREETSEEMLEPIGLLSDKTVGKLSSCQLPSGSKETRKKSHMGINFS